MNCRNTTKPRGQRTRWWGKALALATLLIAGGASAQVNYSANFDANSTGWTGNFTRSTATTGCGTSPHMRRNVFSTTVGNLISPSTGTANGGVITISYDYKISVWSAGTVPAGTPWGSFTVQYGATATGPWTNIATVTDEAQTTSCITKSHTFTPPTGALFIRWTTAWTGGDNWWVFDNISLTEAVPPCSGTPNAGSVVSPVTVCSGNTTVLAATGLTSNLSPGISYQWEESFDGSTGWFPVVDGSGATTATYTTSAINTTRYFRIKTTCSTGPDENVSNVVTVNANPGQFDEDFSSGTIINNCWSQSGTGTAANLRYNTASAFGVGTGSIIWDFYSQSGTTNTLIYTSPAITAIGAGMQIEFEVAGRQYSTTSIDSIYIEESNDGGSSWSLVAAGSNEVGSIFNTLPISTTELNTPGAGDWASRAFPLTAGTNRVRFRGVSKFGNNVLVDNIRMTAVPACQAPTGVAASNETGSSADIAWSCTTCTGPFYVEYGPAGFTPGTDNTAGGGTIWTGGPVAGSPVTITGLSSLTNYDVYVREECTTGVYSANSAVESFTTLCGGTTCNYTARIGDIFGDGWDGSVWVVKENGVTIATLGPQLTSGCNGGTGFVDISVPVCEGSTITLEWTVLGSFTTEKALQFFDANGILLYDHRGTSTSTNCPTVNWTSANSAGTLGVKFTTTSSCAPPACLPATATAVTVPACPGGFNVDVDVTSFGETLSIPETSVTLNYTVNAVPQTPVVVSSLGITTLTGFSNGDAVVVTLAHAGDSNCDATLSSLTYTCPPANDLCADAIAISCNSVTNASTANSTTTGAPATTCGGFSMNTAGGIWYTLQGWDGPITIDLSGSSFDTKLAVYTGTCGALVCVDGDDDDGAGTTSLVTFAGSASENYYVYVTGFGTNTGNVVMTVTCGSNNPVCPANGLTVEFQTDALPFETTWEIRNGAGNVVASSGGPLVAPNGIQTESACLPDGCYTLRVLDAGGDGMTTGGYILRTQGTNERIIDNRNNFSGGSVSAISGGQGFCLPMSNDKLVFTSCDKLDWVSGQYVVAAPNAAVSAEWIPNAANNLQDNNSGYEFWIFDPNGSYSFRRFRSHNVSDGFGPASATRACHMKLNNWALASQVPANVLMNVRVRARVNGVNGEFGPACRLEINPALAACPQTNLMDIPDNQYFSCGATRQWGIGNFVHARPVSGANRYQFRFRIPAEGFSVVRQTTTYFVQLNWTTLPLEDGKTYDVDVRVSKDGGATWCSTSDPWGNVCQLTINNSNMNNNMSLAIGEAPAELRMFPNPNRGDVLTFSLSSVEQGVSTVSVDIYDLTGKRVSARTLAVAGNNVNTSIDLGGELAAGMYLVNITAGTSTYTERLVIQP